MANPVSDQIADHINLEYENSSLAVPLDSRRVASDSSACIVDASLGSLQPEFEKEELFPKYVSYPHRFRPCIKLDCLKRNAGSREKQNC